MKKHSSPSFMRTGRRRRGFSYIESVVSILILGTVIPAGLNLYGVYAQGVMYEKETALAHALASDLMAEILGKAFEDPALPEGSFGPGGDEPNRSDFDDVDDYDIWVEAPPADLDGTPLDVERYDGFVRWVWVWNVNPSNWLQTVSDGSTAVKCVAVVVAVRGKNRAYLVSYRTRNSAYE